MLGQAIGLLVGVIIGFLGAGGFNNLCFAFEIYPYEQAVGTSLFIILLTR
jgi:uncharacterized membrane protein YfcA